LGKGKEGWKKQPVNATFKDWTDLVHALAWPLVVLVALVMFHRSVTKVLSRIPFERTTSVKAGGLGELKMTKGEGEEKTAKEMVISAIDPPSRPKLSEKKREQ
jgi:hypothetical protein